jgi:hypothetical protein
VNRRLCTLFTTLVVCFNSSLAGAAVSRYTFKPSVEPSFQYNGGDLIWVNIAAQLSGQVSISTDESTGAADLRFENVVIHSVFSSFETGEMSELPKEWTTEFYEGKMLTELDAFDFSIPGKRMSPTEIRFGPSLSEGAIRYVQHFRFTFDANSYRLAGGSFYCDDCPNYHINGQLIPIPEPSTFGGLMTALICVAYGRRRRA